MRAGVIKTLFKRFVLPTYRREGPVFVKGKGSFLWDSSGRKYIDFFPGWGVGILGHSHPRITKILSNQAKQLIHIPNNLYHPYQALLAERIIENSFPGRVFFANSGTEAVEAALKLARAFGKREGRYKIVTMKNSFHGRTLGSLSATAQPVYQSPFRPLLSGFKVAKFGSFDSFLRQFDKKTIAVILEPIQGEGGVNLAAKDYFLKLRKFCSFHNILMIFDEIQTGMGRTGKMFAFQHYGVKPDLFTISKGLGAGFPISALVVKKKFSQVLSAGMHASTFGGSPLACRVGIEVFNVIKQEKILENVKRNENLIKDFFQRIRQKYDFIKEARGKGLMWALELRTECEDVFPEALKEGLIINCTHKRIIRLLPALNIDASLLLAGLEILEKVLTKLKR